MAFVDEITINVSAGDGGDGVVRWRHEKGKEFSGPSGGNGGMGGDVYMRAVLDIGILSRYRTVKKFSATDGEDGFRDNKRGKKGDDLTIDVPVGSIVTNIKTKEKFEFTEKDQKFLILKGGRGGLGNDHFKSSTNTTPKEFTEGENGESSEFLIELELIAQIGLVGLPNAGKSSLLNVLTNSNAKVGSFAFTTLEPNLGDMHGFIIADIPGLIEGASDGKGLGHKFLRHIKRTKKIVHCVSLESSDVLLDYDTVRKELIAYDEDLASKPEIILATKLDTVTESDLKEKISLLKTRNKDVLPVTVLDDEVVKNLKEHLISGLN